jgi:hypothetical protein
VLTRKSPICEERGKERSIVNTLHTHHNNHYTHLNWYSLTMISSLCIQDLLSAKDRIMLFTAVNGNEKEGRDEEKGGKMEEQEIKNDDPLQYTNLDLNRIISDHLLLSKDGHHGKRPLFQQEMSRNAGTMNSNQVGQDSKRQSVTLDTFKAFDHSILQPNTFQKSTLMHQRLERALSQNIADDNQGASSSALRRGSVPGEWRLSAKTHPDLAEERRRRASVPGGTAIGSERGRMN